MLWFSLLFKKQTFKTLFFEYLIQIFLKCILPHVCSLDSNKKIKWNTRTTLIVFYICISVNIQRSSRVLNTEYMLLNIHFTRYSYTGMLTLMYFNFKIIYVLIKFNSNINHLIYTIEGRAFNAHKNKII